MRVSGVIGCKASEVWFDERVSSGELVLFVHGEEDG